MKKQITKLTPAQEARMAPYAQEWIAKALSTEPADRARAEASISRQYQAAGLAPPKVFVWADNPLVTSMAGPIAAAMLGKGGAVNDAVRSAVEGVVGDAVNDAVDYAVRGVVGDAVNDAVDYAVRGVVGDAVNDAVGVAVGYDVDYAVGGAVSGAVSVAVGYDVDYAVRGVVGDAVNVAVDSAVNDAVGDAVNDAMRSAVGANWWRVRWGHMSPSWTAWRLFFVDECELKLPIDVAESAEAWRGEVESCGRWWPHRDFCIVTERPAEIHLGENATGRPALDNESGPAIRFRDGWSIYALGGVRVPEKVVMAPGKITLSEIRDEDNAEVRRLMIERYGWTRYLIDEGAKVLAMDSVPIESWNESAGSIERALVQTKAGQKYLIASDGSTDRTYTLRAPDDAETPEDAYAAVAGASSSKCLAQG